MSKLLAQYSNSLKTRITLLTLATALIVFFALMVLAGQTLRPRMKELLAAQQLTTVSLVAAEINEALVFRLKSLGTLSRRINPGTLTSHALEQSSPNSINLFNDGVFVVDQTGQVIADTPLSAGRVGLNVKDRSYFTSVMANGKPFISSPLVGKKSLHPVIVMAVPLQDKQGRITGVVAGAIDLSQPNFMDRLTENHFGRTGETFLVTPQTRTIVSTSDKKRVMEVLPAPGVSPWIDRFMAGYEGSAVTINPHGLEVLVSVKQVPVAGWYTSVILSTEEAYGPINEVRTLIFILTPLAGLLIAGLIWWMLQRQLRPLMDTTQTIAGFAASDEPAQPLPVTRPDEVGALIGGFNHLLDILRTRQQALHDSKSELQLLASVFTHSSEGILITAADHSVIDTNQAFSRITGFTAKEVRGLNPRHVVIAPQSDEFYATLLRSLESDGEWHGELWNRRKNGDVFAALMTISTVHNLAGDVMHYVWLFSDITRIKENEQQLERIAHFDALTKLPNRLLLTDRLQQGLVQAQRRGQSLAIVFLDLDGFKEVNDKHGHAAGDQLLIEVAGRMKHALREGDTLARLGGDEFVAVLLDVADIQRCEPMLNRLLTAASVPVHFGDAMLQVSASLGVTFYPQAMDIEADQLLRQADQAMYRAKLTGKNRYHVFAPETM